MIGVGGVLITGLVALGTWAGSRRFERRREENRREQSRRDIETALLAEIDAVWRQWVIAGRSDEALAAARRQFAADRAYVPFVTPETGVVIFPALIDQIPLLDRSEIASTVRFYRQVRLIDAVATEMKTKTYAALSPERRESVLVHYLTMIQAGIGMAEEAIADLEATLDTPAADRLAARRATLFNNKGGDRIALASPAAG